ncbi:outer membrane beta-barrel protein [Phenylobacterium sp. RIFCSPHIGHO2_01_FULL_69_31]|uniref:outer membrane beta-barrel protein n=1 Tax=Phenylobacterium sp. RIFCSPHIGHO2_01_FULL_69_31 TaxID=1801944 RepID=UPI0025CCDDAB|nr:outer membrane beta-barrel protein [Phenylobacterium sp. RIFCSPHIGHO2_01_FULL_69_31]
MKLILVAALAAAAGAAQAQTLNSPQIYGSIGYTEKNQSDLGAVQLRLGARFGPNFGVEGEFANGVKSRTDNSLNTQAPSTVKTTLRHEIAAYAVGYLPLSPKADLFARVGYGQT